MQEEEKHVAPPNVVLRQINESPLRELDSSESDYGHIDEQSFDGPFSGEVAVTQPMLTPSVAESDYKNSKTLVLVRTDSS